MTLGIDIYQKYQTVTDWKRVRDFGVSFIYVKGTDGGGLASVHADTYVRGAKSVGIPVGLYHYAELSPSPEAQADVLTAEVRRLGAGGLPPALDLESPFVPGSAARSFAQRFLNRLRANGFTTVTLYANTSMLAGINADTLGVPGVRIWAANYGPNDGQEHGYSYKGHVDVHQYTSVGSVPGINGSIDMNNAYSKITDITEDDVLTPDDGNTEWAYIDIYNGELKKKKVADWIGENNSISRTVSDQVKALQATVDGLSLAAGDPKAVIDAAVAAIKDELAPLFDLAERLKN